MLEMNDVYLMKLWYKFTRKKNAISLKLFKIKVMVDRKHHSFSKGKKKLPFNL